MSNVITARVSDEVLAMIDRLASSRERSRAWIVNKLVDEAAKRQIEFDDFVQVGLDDLAAERVHTQEEMEQWFETRKANRASRIAAE
jgi:predicted transcriptional regulator